MFVLQYQLLDEDATSAEQTADIVYKECTRGGSPMDFDAFLSALSRIAERRYASMLRETPSSDATVCFSLLVCARRE